MDIAVVSKVLAFLFMRDKIRKILDMLESEIFQSNTQEEAKIIEKAKQDTLLYWKITAGISFIANGVNLFTPLIMHLMFPVELEFPICRYSFIPIKYKPIFLYPAYVYQCIGMTSHMLYNVNVDTFFLGILFLAIAQLEILDKKLKRVADIHQRTDEVQIHNKSTADRYAVQKINKCIKHYDEVCK
ncbi:unnamed protein product [Arctia plantaginis]|uniref:Odorant receptor n=1 Tax=Arctia plantaginis TaxID=874455 RepID=A0A8S1A5N0_ARCPL|nr:unnamed protein product [Arctia plantaginis]CAB3240401.1 unnamed protein product [Arctia plantaginis]